MPNNTGRAYHRISEEKRIAIISLQSQDKTQKEISNQLNILLPSIEDVLRKWKLHHTVKDLPKTGRSHIVSDRTRCQLVRMIQNGKIKTAEELAKVAKQFNIVGISSRTACNELYIAGMRVMRMVKKPLLTAEHRRKRFEFTRSHSNWTVDDWKQVIFSDESIITARSILLNEFK